MIHNYYVIIFPYAVYVKLLNCKIYQSCYRTLEYYSSAYITKFLYLNLILHVNCYLQFRRNELNESVRVRRYFYHLKVLKKKMKKFMKHSVYIVVDDVNHFDKNYLSNILLLINSFDCYKQMLLWLERRKSKKSQGGFILIIQLVIINLILLILLQTLRWVTNLTHKGRTPRTDMLRL